MCVSGGVLFLYNLARAISRVLVTLAGGILITGKVEMLDRLRGVPMATTDLLMLSLLLLALAAGAFVMESKFKEQMVQEIEPDAAPARRRVLQLR